MHELQKCQESIALNILRTIFSLELGFPFKLKTFGIQLNLFVLFLFLRYFEKFHTQKISSEMGTKHETSKVLTKLYFPNYGSECSKQPFIWLFGKFPGLQEVLEARIPRSPPRKILRASLELISPLSMAAGHTADFLISGQMTWKITGRFWNLHRFYHIYAQMGGCLWIDFILKHWHFPAEKYSLEKSTVCSGFPFSNECQSNPVNRTKSEMESWRDYWHSVLKTFTECLNPNLVNCWHRL